MNRDISGVINIELSEEDIRRCKEFSLESAGSQQPIEFGTHTTAQRGTAETARDNLIGKLAEVAFMRFLSYAFQIQAQLDFNIYDRSVWDSNDFSLNGHPVDMKGTRIGKWLLVELPKLEFRKKENKLPEYFIFAVTGWKKMNQEGRVEEMPTGIVSLKGWASLKQICHPDQIGLWDARICEGIQNTIFLPTGTKIPNTNTILQADNCGRYFEHLEKSWSKLINQTYKC